MSDDIRMSFLSLTLHPEKLIIMLKKNIKGVTLTLLLFLASCSPKSEYTNALPKDASVVVAADLDAMAEKGCLKNEKGRHVSDKMKAALKSGLEGDAARLAERIIDDPKESGLSLTDKVYLFATPHASAFALLAKVGDEDKLEELMKVLRREQIATPLREESGCRWTQIGRAVCAFNGGTFLVMQHSKGDAESIKGTLFSLMRQKEGEGYAALPEFKELEAGGNDIAAVADLSVIPQEWTTPLRMGLSGDIRLQDIKYLVTLNFEKGRIEMNAKSLTRNATVLEFFESMNKITSPVKGNLLDAYPGGTMFWMGGNLHGKTMYEVLCSNPAIGQFINNPLLPVDVKRIFSALEGDFAVGYTSVKEGGGLFYADVTDSDFLRTFEELRPLLALTGGQVKLYDTGENQYAIRIYDTAFWFGVKGNLFYVTNRRELAEEAGRTYGASLRNRPWADEAMKSRMFVAVNLGAMSEDASALRLLASLFGGNAMMLKAVLSECETLTFGIPEWSRGKMELIMKDKSVNVLELMVKGLETL